MFDLNWNLREYKATKETKKKGSSVSDITSLIEKFDLECNPFYKLLSQRDRKLVRIQNDF